MNDPNSAEICSDEDRSFAGWVRYHLTVGTRPSGKNRVWTHTEFATECGYAPESSIVNIWCKGPSLPPTTKISRLEFAFFGSAPSQDSAQYAIWRALFRNSYEKARLEKSLNASDLLGEAPLTAKVSRRVIGEIPVRIPMHFFGRDQALQEIRTTLTGRSGRVAITALRGMRGVGKTTLAAAYAEAYGNEYDIIWWVRAEDRSTIVNDLMAFARQVPIKMDRRDEENAKGVVDHLNKSVERALLIYDNAPDVESLRIYVPAQGTAHLIITSNSHAWGELAVSVPIEVWPSEVGAEYLTARTGWLHQQSAAFGLAEKLGGLPLAHEQAAAYCERLSISFSKYEARLDALPLEMLDDPRHAPAAYRDGTTVARTFALAITEAAKLHPAAQNLIFMISLLPIGAVPVCLFSLGLEAFDEPLLSQLAGDGLWEAMAALRSFALIESPLQISEQFEAVQLHRLVRVIARGQQACDNKKTATIKIITALKTAFSRCSYFHPKDREEMNNLLRLHDLLHRVQLHGEFKESIPKQEQRWIEITLKDHEMKIGTPIIIDSGFN